MTYTPHSESLQPSDVSGAQSQSGSRQLDRYTIASKVILLGLLSILVGFVMSSESAKSAAEAEALTFEEYASQYEEHKAEFATDELSPPIAIVSAMLAFAFTAFFYEGGAWAVAWVLRRLLSRRRASPGGLAGG